MPTSDESHPETSADPVTPVVASSASAEPETPNPDATNGAPDTAVAAPAEAVPGPAKTPFDAFDLHPALRRAIDDLGFTWCTPIQAQSLKFTLKGHDVTGKAQTGTGKTAAFLITLINDMLRRPQQGERFLAEPRALVIAPTRELAIQIADDAWKLTRHAGLHTVTLVGGEDYGKQERALDRQPVDILVATPGRLLDFVENDKVYLGLVELMVIDEADRMLDMGFIPQVRRIIAHTPKKECRQTLLFSATFTPEILELGQRWALDPIFVEVAPERVATDSVEQKVYLVTTEQKYDLLYNLIAEPGADRVIVFSNRRDQVRKLADNLHRNGVACGLLSGEVAQNKRIKTLDDFKEGRFQVLVATDVAGRGLHIEDVTHVINYTLPEEADDYVHRIGRTGRAGAVGTSISFACEDDSFLLPNIEAKLGYKLPCIQPEERLLAKAPPFSRESRFLPEKKPGGGGGKGGRSGARPRRR